ncbi:MAG: OprO/OprP family phosphate-selective porin [Thermomonas sp.]|uniref:OprO/OprP family phosphate-selective porin n=1 Tax=Thermomonas sp. TaxID=1971895 RepID=UPI001EC87155|nr:porin [Thermomonas sp.]MBV2210058.1 OprO/OprP family phosphate-selective porin [Thermomonas sp.]
MYRFRLRHALPCALVAVAPLTALAADAPFDIAPIANIQYEWGQTDPTNGPSVSDTDFRRARFGFSVKGRSKTWQMVFDHDFADKTPPDAFLLITPSDNQSFRIGQFKQPFALEDAIADKQTAFLEASPVGAFVISRRIGLEYARWGKRGTFNAAVFGHRLDGTSDSPGVTLRSTWLLRSSKEESAHIGFSLASESPSNDKASFSLNAGTTLNSLKTATTGSISGVDRIDRMAVEGLWVRGAWSLQGEIAQVTLQRDLGNIHGSAGDVQLTWSPTGDGRNYKRGVATAPTPKGHVGWELALRYGTMDLNSGPVKGGHTENWGLAATCYPHPNVRIIANLLQFNGSRMGISNNPLTAGVRLQFTY